MWEYWGWISKAKKIDIDVGGYATVPSIGIANGPKNKLFENVLEKIFLVQPFSSRTLESTMSVTTYEEGPQLGSVFKYLLRDINSDIKLCKIVALSELSTPTKFYIPETTLDEIVSFLSLVVNWTKCITLYISDVQYHSVHLQSHFFPPTPTQPLIQYY